MSSHRRRLPYLDTIHDQAFYIILARKQLAKKQSEGPRYAAVQRTSIFPASVAHPTPNSSARTGLASSHCLLASFYISGASCSPAALSFPPCCLPPSYLGFLASTQRSIIVEDGDRWRRRRARPTDDIDGVKLLGGWLATPAGMAKQSCCHKKKLRRGLWSPEEDEKLMNHIAKYGNGCWSSVPKLAGIAS